MDSGQSSFVLETRTVFLHQIKGLARLLGRNLSSEEKILSGKRLVGHLFNQALALGFSDPDLPDQHARKLYHSFVIDGYLASSLGSNLMEDLRDSEIFGDREEVVTDFLQNLGEIIDRAVITYENLYDCVRRKTAA